MDCIFITQNSSISSYNYKLDSSQISFVNGQNQQSVPVFSVNYDALKNISYLSNFSILDKVTKLALYCSHQIKEKISSGEKNFLDNFCVIAGSARGATNTLEKSFYNFFLENTTSALTSPLTTAGGIASTVYNLWPCDLSVKNSFSIGTSMTCASFFEALLVAQSLILSKRVNKALVIGAESALTPFTIAQMQALRIYSNLKDKYPCQPLAKNPEAKNSLVLGEGASAFLLETQESIDSSNHQPILKLESIGIMQEKASTFTGIDANGDSFYLAMSQALSLAGEKKFPDLIVAHAPGTFAGDNAELNAILKLAKELDVKKPCVFSTKYLHGHTFGASGALSLDFLINSIKNRLVLTPPYPTHDAINFTITESIFKPNSTVLINGAGFGGVVCSVLVRNLS